MKLQKDKIHSCLMSFGKTTGCHQIPERSFHYHGYQFPICARCTGIVVGYVIAILLLFQITLPMEMCVVLCTIMFFDWYLQYLEIRKSTNIRRFLSGTLCGIGYMHLVIRFLKFVWIYVKNLL